MTPCILCHIAKDVFPVKRCTVNGNGCSSRQSREQMLFKPPLNQIRVGCFVVLKRSHDLSAHVSCNDVGSFVFFAGDTGVYPNPAQRPSALAVIMFIDTALVNPTYNRRGGAIKVNGGFFEQGIVIFFVKC